MKSARIAFVFTSLFALIVVAIACTKQSASAGYVMYAVEPPVTANTPAGLKATSRRTTAARTRREEVIDIVKDRLFSDGPTYLKSILASIDSRMDEIETRAGEGSHPCIDEAPTEFAITTPIDLLFPQQLSCYEEFGVTARGTHWMAFGKKGDFGYLREGMSSGNAIQARVDADENVEAWIQVGDEDHVEDMSAALLHLKSTKATGLLEFTVSGHNIGVGCGIQYQSNATHIYIAGKFAEPPSCAGTTADAVCVEGATLTEVDVSNCTTAGLDTFTLTALTDSTLSYTEIYTVGSQPITGLTDF